MDRPFSDELEEWLQRPGERTVAELGDVFGEKSFAVGFLILMAVPALPLPTGGVTHVFEIVVMLLSLELIAGRRTPWLPRKLQDTAISPTLRDRMLPVLVRRLRWFEQRSSRRLGDTLGRRPARALTGLAVGVLALVAFLAPPFTGLDTVPSLGAVIISIGVLLEDAVWFVAGLVVGALGIGLVVGLGAAATELVKSTVG